MKIRFHLGFILFPIRERFNQSTRNFKSIIASLLLGSPFASQSEFILLYSDSFTAPATALFKSTASETSTLPSLLISP